MATTSSPVDDASTWKRCSTCRGPIAYGSTYYVCSVSTCNRVRTIYRFCKVECWEEHLPLMRHREAWAVEETAPTREAWAAQEAVTGPAPAARPVAEAARPSAAASKPAPASASAPKPAPAAASAPAPAPASASSPKPAPAPAVAPASADAPRRRIVGSAPKPASDVPAPAVTAAGSDDVLVVVSRFKTYVKDRFGMNTSDAVMDLLSDHLRAICHRAAENARNDGRKTVMDRDFEFLRRKG